MDDGQGQEIETEVAELREDLSLLQSSVREMQEEYARELRTQQVTVVDEEGVQRVVLSARYRTGSVLVQVDSPEGLTTGAELYACEDPDGGEPGLGVCLVREGDVVEGWPQE